MGLDKKPFIIHKDLLCHYSVYFKKAFNGEFREAAESLVELVDTDTTTFGVIVDWLYTQRVPNENGEWAQSSTQQGLDKEELQDPYSTILTSVHIFADRLDMPQLRAATLEKLYTRYTARGVPWYETITMAFENLPATSPLLLFYLHLYVYRWNEGSDGPEEIEMRD